MNRLMFYILMAALMSACGKEPAEQTPAVEAVPATAGESAVDNAAAESDAPMGAALVDTAFNPKLLEYIQTLSSDEFEGRSPASPGEEKTTAYISQQFQRAGLQPGVDGSYLQPVPLVEIIALEASPLSFKHDGGQLDLTVGDDAVVWTKRVTDSAAVSDSEVVFVGYGVVAPEYNWNDYAGVDVRGKTVLMLVNDPGFATEDPNLFRGRTMTYYGRWTYKFEEAARQGAAMALLIHETAAAGYGFDVVQGSWTGAQFDLVHDDKNAGRAALEGWISGAAADRLVTAGGESLATLTQRARSADFQAVPLKLSASAAVRNSIRESTSNNVVGVLPGAERPDEYFLYMGHWDHLGVDTTLEGDQIYNGAQDNATGTASLMALAEVFAAGPRPARSLAFVAVTAEESGLLGSRYFGENPPFPISQIVAGINMDALNIDGPMRDLVVVGHGNSELEPIAERLARAQNRRVEPNPFPEKGFYYRSDHFNLAKKGVPMLYAKGGVDHFEKGEAYGRERAKDYVTVRYHKPADEYGEWWDLRGMNQDLNLFHRMGLEIANGDMWPNWYEGNEFRAIRDRSRGTVQR